MSLQLRWVLPDEYDKVAQTRMLCYGSATRDIERFREGLNTNPRVAPGDCLLAERDGKAVGTLTSLSQRMWVRGGVVPCQGVAWVGTIKTSRRSGSSAGEARQPGIATQLMDECVRVAREREQVVSALMPFRGSFYEKFGYGFMERRAAWTVPLVLLPSGSFEGTHFVEPYDLSELVACHLRCARAGQCDIERIPETWQWMLDRWQEGMVAIDRPTANGPVHGWMYIQHVHESDGSDTLKITEIGYENLDALKRQLYFLASLRDQYTRTLIHLPGDLPLNRLLRESQMTHRDNRNHPTPETRPYNRMQLRVLDHKRLIEVMNLPEAVRGQAAVAIREAEGHTSRLWIDISDGKASVSETSGADEFSCTDAIWAAVVTGDLPASRAVELGLARCNEPSTALLLDVFAAGPAPFAHEHF